MRPAACSAFHSFEPRADAFVEVGDDAVGDAGATIESQIGQRIAGDCQ